MSSLTPAGVIVTYFPDCGFEHRLVAIAREVRPLVVVDNSANPKVKMQLDALCVRQGAKLLANDSNLGLGSALNQAFRQLATLGVTTVIAFDQDSTPPLGISTALLTTAAATPNVAAVGANWQDEATPNLRSRHLQRHRKIPFWFERNSANVDLPDVTCVITSGTLFDLRAWQDLGGFDEALFLDLVDTDYCLRARFVGHRIAVSASARMLHRRGAKRPVKRLGRTWWPAFMPPLRLRYLFRNRVHLFKRHGIQAPHWVAFEIVYSLKILAEIIFLEDRKLAKFAACLRGTWDGILGRGGRIR
jgi:rhamnosyltransferase